MKSVVSSPLLLLVLLFNLSFFALFASASVSLNEQMQLDYTTDSSRGCKFHDHGGQDTTQIIERGDLINNCKVHSCEMAHSLVGATSCAAILIERITFDMPKVLSRCGRLPEALRRPPRLIG